jgi:sulfate transport system ATP-binding protein
MSIEVANVTKRFGKFTALDNINLSVASGSLTALLGPSGSGKTTLLRIISGLETADAGTVSYHGDDVTHQPARKRNVGFVFQHYALFRHMTVFENVAFGMRVRKAPAEQITRKVRELLALVRMENLERRYPSQLSGGQRQRVALARALATQPKVLLLDEPFGALDAKVRVELRQWLRRLHDEIHMTSVFETHDQEEAFEVADQVVVMNAGRIEQAGRPEHVFEHPANAFVMSFLGDVNVFHGRVQNGRALLSGFDVQFPDYPHAESLPAEVYLRPHEIDVQHAANGNGGPRAKVSHICPAGSVVKLQLETVLDERSVSVELAVERYRELRLNVGDTVCFSPRQARVFVPDYAI